MSSRAHRPWLKKVKRIVGRRLRSGCLSTEDALRLCAELLSSTQRQEYLYLTETSTVGMAIRGGYPPTHRVPDPMGPGMGGVSPVPAPT
ncbi:hypothetical protein EJB05_54661 [Eragrostis curvula]|uniref:Uncharacterized protein n=1 Tax=Eragrostis curvula TaxID=38414 RepID=A0A5J9SLV9_9POAL|nr:hypothetical protein EJB05_54661 [Eragrostis curvula]